MLRMKHVAVVAVVAMAGSSTAVAESRIAEGWNEWSASVMGKYIVTDDDRNDIDYGSGVRFGLSHPIRDHIGIEIAGFGNQLRRDQEEGRDWQYALGVDGFYFLREEDLTPYLVAGVGGLFNDFAGGNDRGPYANAGIGIRIPLFWNRVNIRAEARYFADWTDDAMENARYDDARFYVGLEFPLTSPPEPPPPEVRTETVEVERIVTKIPELQRLDGVTFEFDSAQLDPNARVVLNRVAEDLDRHAHVTVEIAGHTDNIGGKEYNLDLSQARAESVREYLVNWGIDPDRIEATGYGMSEPVADNDTPEGRRLNRRIEMRRTDNGANGASD